MLAYPRSSTRSLAPYVHGQPSRPLQQPPAPLLVHSHFIPQPSYTPFPQSNLPRFHRQPRARSSSSRSTMSTSTRSRSQSSPTSTSNHSYSSSSSSSSSTSSRRHTLIHGRYFLTDQLGRGLMGTVYQAVDRNNHSDVAIKVVKKNNVHRKDEKVALFREVNVLKRLKHPSILAFHQALEDSKAVYIITEFCPRGDLYTYLDTKASGLPEREALKYMRQLFSALHYMHSNGVSHRDIKPENILLDQRGNIRLADFGLCHLRPPTGPVSTNHYCGTLQYAAPEIAAGRPYIPQYSDMWSCGILFYALLTKCLPYKRMEQTHLVRDIRHLDVDALLNSRRLAHVSKGSRVLLSELLSRTPKNRPTAQKAMRLVEDALLGPREYRSKHIPWK